MKDPIKNEQCRRMYEALLPNIADYISLYARQRPRETAIIEHNTGDAVTWKQLDTSVSAFAAKLLSMGLSKGDIVATSLPLLKEHVYLIYACYRIGLIVAPLDLRLKAKEVITCMEKMKPKAYFFLGKTPVADFRPLIREVMAACPSIRHWVQFQKEPDLIMEGAVGVTDFVKDIKKIYVLNLLTRRVKKANRLVGKRDACLIVFTTGSTGSPKPALLCHENILMQNIALCAAFELKTSDRMLINLPPSHVGCTTEQLGTVLFGGGIAVILHIFDAKLSLEAIERYRVTVIGQIPALFNMEWRLPEYGNYDLSSLRFAIYGGQAVSREFLVKMKTMAPRIGTGLGLTETAGFCTYTHVDADVDELARGIGYDSPLCPISIRNFMQTDGTAGAEKRPGEVGEICFSGPQICLGYLGDPGNTAKTISREGFCYTGDIGFYDQQGLHFSGRAKLVIKPKGYQVFPEDVENHIHSKLRDRAGMVAIVGVEHEVFGEGIVAFVECREGKTITPDEVLAACSDISAYSRPSHVVILEAGEIPLNRVAKTDYLNLRERAKDIVRQLRAEGHWDR